jgi:hypothetical protein
LVEAYKTYGREVFGLDSIWKWTRHRVPFWILTVEAPGNGGLVVAIINASQGTAHLLSPALQAFMDKAGIAADDMPAGMIDHDPAELKALVTIKVNLFLKLNLPFQAKPILCRFHSHATFSDKATLLDEGIFIFRKC